jgi:hypothetical protein
MYKINELQPILNFPVTRLFEGVKESYFFRISERGSRFVSFYAGGASQLEVN